MITPNLKPHMNRKPGHGAQVPRKEADESVAEWIIHATTDADINGDTIFVDHYRECGPFLCILPLYQVGGTTAGVLLLIYLACCHHASFILHMPTWAPRA